MMRLTTLLLISCALMINGCASAEPPYKRLTVPDKSIKFERIAMEQYELHYAYAGDPGKPGVMFIHGTPGSWPAFESYLVNKELQRDFLLVSVDRPGWGESSQPAEELDGDFELNAKAFVRVMDQYPDKNWILVGHSLGASMAPQAALMAPQRTKALLLLAGSLDPKLGRPRWYNRLAHTWVGKWLIPDSLGYSNDEIMALRRQLETMSRQVQSARLDTRLIVMQGMKDKLVSPKNPRYVTEYWQQSFSDIALVELDDGGHFLPWLQADLVIEKIIELGNGMNVGPSLGSGHRLTDGPAPSD